VLVLDDEKPPHSEEAFRHVRKVVNGNGDTFPHQFFYESKTETYK
jgi:hypothetical protein